MTDPGFHPTLGILCAIEPELTAVLLSFSDQRRWFDDTSNILYHCGVIHGQSAVATCLREGEIGLVSASRHADAFLRRFPSLKEPASLRFMTGIAGGIPSSKTKDELRLGDVVVASSVLNYSRGKAVHDGHQQTGKEHEAPERLRAYMPELQRQYPLDSPSFKKVIDTLIEEHQRQSPRPGNKWPNSPQSALRDVLFHASYIHANPHKLNCDDCDHSKIESDRKRPLNSPAIHYGLIASADFVLKDSNIRQDLKQSNDRILAVDMESEALRQEEFIIVRGISDYADSHKNDDWQPYAAVVAVACTLLLIETINSPSFQPLSTSPLIPLPLKPLRRPSRTSSDTFADPFVERITTVSTFSSNTGSQSVETRNTESWSADGEEAVTSPDDQYSWSVTLPFKSIQVKVSNTLDHDGHYEYGFLNFRERRASSFHRAHREISIEDGSAPMQHSHTVARTLWLPLANVRAKSSGTSLILNFSNCNGFQKDVINRRVQNRPIYNPSRPNTVVQIDFQDAAAVAKMVQYLHYGLVSIPNHSLQVSFGQPEWKIFFPQMQSDLDANQVLILHPSSTPEAFEEVHFLHVGRYFDASFQSRGGATSITFHGLASIQYHPLNAVSATWPPLAVKQNESGKPLDYSFTGDSTITIKLDHDKQVILYEIPKIISGGWELVAEPLEAAFGKNPKLSLMASRKRQSEVTLWVKDDTLHILIRSMWSEEMVKWHCIRLQRSQSNGYCSPGKKEVTFDCPPLDCRVYMQNVVLVSGTCVERSNLLPIQYGTSTTGNNSDPDSYQLITATVEDRRAFLEALEGYVIVRERR